MSAFADFIESRRADRERLGMAWIKVGFAFTGMFFWPFAVPIALFWWL